MIYELTPICDKRKSFYNKARVEIKPDGTQVLYSYNTLVACITKDGKLFCNGTYSQTTTRHIKEFFRQETNKIFSTKDLKELPSM